MRAFIDFNCDLGEGCGNDAEILPHISSASLACGLHAGDSESLSLAIAQCMAAGVAIGAHPSFADRENFGRRELPLPPSATYSLVLYQIGAAAALARAAGGQLAHVKPHGALYNLAARNADVANAVARAVRDFSPSLLLYGLAGSELTTAGEQAGISVVHEVFAERRYEADGTLTPRSEPDAVIETLAESIQQVRRMLMDGVVISRQGRAVPISAQTLCLHGDRPDAAKFARALRQSLLDWGVQVRAPSSVAAGSIG